METFTNFFVGQPLVQLVISGLFFVVYFLTMYNPNLRAKTLLTPAVLWLAWGVWEWAITRLSPEANIRIDLLIIFPVVFIVSIVAIVMFFRKPKVVSNDE
jgi:hypothetical protein